ncbi:MAG: SIS domain-containing protein [Nitrososphaerota archaeon]|jgi:6-phospho-3-hexuloisomerase|uniref:SIS domain-containing protein n=1 Tax=Candidatus Bathycorpusculum sp. TaxID=2994959 RepID=UPI002834FBA3|nr:SIS domain-containing protein [Candidatus Termitimicrobium sp.]MCL2432003.1 SIS domain-containing protein [Candidatus Termitimicrobium sp.]MDR0492914.1 SIS domain-containing protein [Nitrososphaerota archaeon]
MKSRVSSLGYVNRIQENILAIKKKELAPLYEELKAADCVICGGSGRSLYSLNAAMSQIALATAGWRNKVVLTPDDPGFPGKSMYEAAMDLERRYKKTLLLMNSGSGYSDDPLVMAQDLAKYIEDKKSTRFSMGLLTSTTESPLAEISSKYGSVIQLKGRGKLKPSFEYSETGMMGDIFELGTLELLNSMVEAVYRNLDVDEVYKLCSEEFETIGDMIDNNINSETYIRLVDLLERRTNLFLGGKGTASEIAKMTGVRLFHIKSFLGDNVYITRGVNTPHPRAGDLEILLSCSGETRPVIIWADVLKKFAGTVFAITSNEDSTLAKKADLKIILPEKAKPSSPRRFYTRAAYVLSPLPMKLAERLGERGLNLPEYIISWYHSATQ